MSSTLNYFDAIDYAKRLRKNGAPPELANVIAQETAKVIRLIAIQINSMITNK